MRNHCQSRCCRRRSFLAILPMMVALFPAIVQADQVVMKNGDRVTGSIIKQDGKEITIKTALFGTVTAPWDQVASIQSEQPVNLVLKNGQTLVGPLSTSQGRMEIGTTSIAPENVAAIRNPDQQRAYERLLHPTLRELWSGNVILGWAGTNGNAKTLTFTTTLDAARTTSTDKTSITFNLIKASALVDGTSASTAEAARGGIAYDHNVSHRLFVNAFNDYEYDKFQRLDLRFVLGGGFGYHAVKGPRASLDVLGGAAFNHSAFSTPLTRNNGEAFWGDEYSFKLNSITSLTQAFRMFNQLSDTHAYRVNADLAFTTRLRRWLSWNVSLSDRFLSDPVPGRKTNDWLYTTGLGVTFGK